MDTITVWRQTRPIVAQQSAPETIARMHLYTHRRNVNYISRTNQ